MPCFLMLNNKDYNAYGVITYSVFWGDFAPLNRESGT